MLIRLSECFVLVLGVGRPTLVVPHTPKGTRTNLLGVGHIYVRPDGYSTARVWLLPLERVPSL